MRPYNSIRYALFIDGIALRASINGCADEIFEVQYYRTNANIRHYEGGRLSREQVQPSQDGRNDRQEDPVARKTIEQRIAQLEARKKTLKARLGKQERAEDTRRKILLGALVLHRLDHGKDEFSRSLSAWLTRELPGFLTRDIDRQLFSDLLKPETTATPQTEHSTGGAAE